MRSWNGKAGAQWCWGAVALQVTLPLGGLMKVLCLSQTSRRDSSPCLLRAVPQPKLSLRNWGEHCLEWAASGTEREVLVSMKCTDLCPVLRERVSTSPLMFLSWISYHCIIFWTQGWETGTRKLHLQPLEEGAVLWLGYRSFVPRPKRAEGMKSGKQHSCLWAQKSILFRVL